MYKILSVILISLYFLGCGSEPSFKANIPKDVKYKVYKEETKRNIKRVLQVDLNKKVTEDVLKNIALELKSREKLSFERTFDI